MLNTTIFKDKLVHLSLIDISKIVIIIFVSVSLLANFVPYYDGADDKLYGITAIQLSEGQFGVTNEFLQGTDSEFFVHRAWVKTSHDNAIPIGMHALPSLASIFYSLFGYYGLFYLGPVLTIFLMITSERISSKLFGNFAGLITLVILVSDWKIFQVGIRLLTDNIFAVLFIIGLFFLIKFFKEKNEKYVLLCSSFFVASTFFRIIGLVFFPIEIFILLAGYFIINYQTKKKNQEFHGESSKNQMILRNYLIFNKLKSKKFFKVLVFLFVPWVIFLLFWTGFNSYYFTDPLTNYETERKFAQPEIQDLQLESTFLGGNEEELKKQIRDEKKKESIRTFVEFNNERFEWIKYYAVSLMPDTIKFTSTYLSSTDTKTDWKSANWISIFSILILISAVAISLKTKIKRLEVLTTSFFVFGFLLFFSAAIIAPSGLFPPSGGIQERYMLSASIMSFMLFGYCTDRFRSFSFLNGSQKSLNKILRIGFIILLAIFLISSFYIMPPLQDILQSKFHFNNPADFTERFPLDSEGLDEKSIIVGENGRGTVEYGFIYFNPFIDFSKKLGWDIERLEVEPIHLLKNIMGNGSEAYAFKKDMKPLDEKYFKHLEKNYDIILKEYSETFCQIKIIDNSIESISDSICYSQIDRNPNYGWDVRVKPPWDIFK